MQNYVAQLDNGNYYIGRTENVEKLCNGKIVSEWTKLHSVRSIYIIPIPDDETTSVRTIFTLIYMKRYGVDKVRGGGYSHVNFNESNLREINRYLERFEVGSPYETVKKIYNDLISIKKKIWKFSSDQRIDYYQLLDKLNELEKNPKFLEYSTTKILTRSKKREIAEDVDFYSPKDLTNRKKKKV